MAYFAVGSVYRYRELEGWDHEEIPRMVIVLHERSPSEIYITIDEHGTIGWCRLLEACREELT